MAWRIGVIKTAIPPCASGCQKIVSARKRRPPKATMDIAAYQGREAEPLLSRSTSATAIPA